MSAERDDANEHRYLCEKAQRGDKDAHDKLFKALYQTMVEEAREFAQGGTVPEDEALSIIVLKFTKDVVPSFRPEFGRTVKNHLKLCARNALRDEYHKTSRRTSREEWDREGEDSQADQVASRFGTIDDADARLRIEKLRGDWQLTAWCAFDQFPYHFRHYCRTMELTGRFPEGMALMAVGELVSERPYGQHYWLFSRCGPDVARAALSQALFVDGWTAVEMAASGESKQAIANHLGIDYRKVGNLLRLVTRASRKLAMRFDGIRQNLADVSG